MVCGKYFVCSTCATRHSTTEHPRAQQDSIRRWWSNNGQQHLERFFCASTTLSRTAAAATPHQSERLNTIFEDEDVDCEDYDDFEAIVERYIEPSVLRKLDEIVYADDADEHECNERHYPSPPHTPIGHLIDDADEATASKHAQSKRAQSRSAPRRRNRVDNCARIVQ